MFTLVPEFILELGVRLLHAFQEFGTYVETNLVIHQSLRSFIVKKNLDIGKKIYAERFASVLFEHGHLKKASRNVPNYFGVEAKRGGYVHYNTLQEYLAANTRVIAFPFDRLDYLFRVYLAVVTLLLLLNLAHYFVTRVIICQLRIWFLRRISFA